MPLFWIGFKLPGQVTVLLKTHRLDYFVIHLSSDRCIRTLDYNLFHQNCALQLPLLKIIPQSVYTTLDMRQMCKGDVKVVTYQKFK